MKVFKLILKITFIISLLINSAGQGYALRPMAAAQKSKSLPIEAECQAGEFANGLWRWTTLPREEQLTFPFRPAWGDNDSLLEKQGVTYTPGVYAYMFDHVDKMLPPAKTLEENRNRQAVWEKLQIRWASISLEAALTLAGMESEDSPEIQYIKATVLKRPLPKKPAGLYVYLQKLDQTYTRMREALERHNSQHGRLVNPVHPNFVHPSWLRRLISEQSEKASSAGLHQNDFKMLGNISSKMSMHEIKACIRNLDGIEMREDYEATEGSVRPYWGVFTDVNIPQKYMNRIKRAIYLKSLKGKLSEEKIVIPLEPKDYYQVNGRWVRAIKIKGISARIAKIKNGQMRHSRLRGIGDMPCLVPYVRADGKVMNFSYDVGEPYGFKRFRSVLNEIVHTRYLFSEGQLSIVPMGMGIYENPELLYKGEPVAFSIYGVEQPDDLRFGDVLYAKQRKMFRELDALAENDELEKVWGELEKLIQWRRKYFAMLIRRLRKSHDRGVIHNEPHLDNAQFFRGSLTLVDHEESASRFNLTKKQFLEGVSAEVRRIVSAAYGLDNNDRALYRYLRKNRHLKGVLPAKFPPVDFLAYYFTDKEMGLEERKKIRRLQPYSRHQRIEGRKFGELIQRNISDIFGEGDFREGIDWEDYARPFEAGFSISKPVWQPDSTTTFDMIMYAPHGEGPFAKKRKHPTKGLRRAEEAIYKGKFEDAAAAYENILKYGYRRNRSLDKNIFHNLAAIYLILRKDANAMRYFELAYPEETVTHTIVHNISKSSAINADIASAA